MVEVALHLVHPFAIAELRGVVDEVDAEYHARPELGRGTKVGTSGRVHRRVVDDGRVHVLLHRFVEHVLGMPAADELEARAQIRSPLGSTSLDFMYCQPSFSWSPWGPSAKPLDFLTKYWTNSAVSTSTGMSDASQCLGAGTSADTSSDRRMR